MYKSIFVPVSSHGDQSPAVAMAGMLAETFGAVADCHFASKVLDLLTPEENKAISQRYEAEGFTKSLEFADVLYRAQMAKRADQTKVWFDGLRRKIRGGAALHWREAFDVFGDGDQQILGAAFGHDLTIASNNLSKITLDTVLEQALLKSGRPLLLMRKALVAKELSDMSVMLAWKPSAQCIRAAWFALPLLQKARRVVLAHAAEEKSAAVDVASFSTYLAAHGVKAETQAVNAENGAAQTLLNLYQSTGSELLVMGAYSHSRMRELVFGGVSRFFLDNQGANLFLAH